MFVGFVQLVGTSVCVYVHVFLLSSFLSVHPLPSASHVTKTRHAHQVTAGSPHCLIHQAYAEQCPATEELYARDGLHLSGKGAAAFAEGLSGAVAIGLGKVRYLN